jgi:hypothetical protein
LDRGRRDQHHDDRDYDDRYQDDGHVVSFPPATPTLLEGATRETAERGTESGAGRPGENASLASGSTRQERTTGQPARISPRARMLRDMRPPQPELGGGCEMRTAGYCSGLLC